MAILQDLSGPKIRTGRLEDGKAIALRKGDPLIVAIGDEVGGPGRVFTTYGELALRVHTGDHLLLDDGKIDLEVEATSPAEIHTRVVDGGELGEHKGINAPHVPLRSDITEKDQRDLAFGLALGVDLVALSFVQSADDIPRVRTADGGGRPRHGADHRQARTPGGDRAARRDPRRRRRGDGGARRPGARDSARARAARAEADPAQGARHAACR